MRARLLVRDVQVVVLDEMFGVSYRYEEATQRVLITAPEEQLAVAETILRRSATVRDAERLVARQLGTTSRRRKRQAASGATTSATFDDLQNRLQQHLGTRVTLHPGEKRGKIEIEYYGNDDLERVLNAMGLAPSES